MLSNGGCISTSNFESAGIQTVLSGPAGGVSSAHITSQKWQDMRRLLLLNMGGTSTDVSLCDGEISMTTESTISGLPIKVPLIDIHTVGAGGGSDCNCGFGWGVTRRPGKRRSCPWPPICYGNNGKEITVTDANLFLGRISPTQFLGGQMSLDV